MDRLTHERCNGIKTGYWSAAKKEELIQRLAAYENTGLEPEQIEAMQGHSVALMAELEEREFPWISVKDKLPDEKYRDDLVLAIVSGRCGNMSLDEAYLLAYYSDGVWGLDDYPDVVDLRVHYWMPLPEPPKGE